MISDNGFDPVVRLREPLLCARLRPAMAPKAAAAAARAGWGPPARIQIGEDHHRYIYTCLT